MILVLGATGNVGRELVGQLSERGQRVRAVVRRDDAELPAGVETVKADLNEIDSLAPALARARAMFMLSGYPDRSELLQRGREAGLEHVVLLSASSAVSGNPDNAVARYHMDSEADVRGSGLSWTVLRPNSFFSNALRWRSQLAEGNTVRLPFADVPVVANDPLDIAAVAAEALVHPSAHNETTYRLSGPAPLFPADQVDILGSALGRPLEFEAQDDDSARAQMSQSMPPEYVEAFFAFFRGGELDESKLHTSVRDVTGRAPRTFAEWASAHADLF
jgi:uncharacterized protein YbjT (DUF2867 family)